MNISAPQHLSSFAPLYLCFLVCLLLFFWGLGNIPFYTKGEPREAIVVWEIYSNGEWILPLRNGIEIPSKPPLFHWFGAFFSHAFGRIDELTIRFPSAALATLGVLLTCLAGMRLWGKEAGLTAAFVLATSLEWWRAATTARVDMTLTFFIVAAFLFFLSLYQEGKGGREKTLLFALLLGLATLAKGPVGALLPCLGVLVFLWLRRDFAFLRKLHLFTGAILFLLVAGSWYALALWQGGKSFFVRQILQENLLRFIATEAGGTGHEHPFYYFIPSLFLGMAPWSFFFPALALSLYRCRHTLAKEGLLYPLVWFGTVFLFFSAASGKRTVYILPLYPAVALLFGAWWQKLRDGEVSSLWLVRLGGYLSALVFLLGGAVLMIQVLGWDFLEYIRPFLHPKDQENLPFFSRSVTDHFPKVLAWVVCSGLGGAFLIRALSKRAWRWSFTCLTGLAIVSLLLVHHTFHPALARRRTLEPFMVRVRQVVNDKVPRGGHPLLFYHTFDNGAVFYARRHIPCYRGTPKSGCWIPSGSSRSRQHVPSYQEASKEVKPPFLLLMWEEEWQRMRQRMGTETGDRDLRQRGAGERSLSLSDISISFVGISKGTGPKGNHRLVLVSVQEGSL